MTDSAYAAALNGGHLAAGLSEWRAGAVAGVVLVAALGVVIRFAVRFRKQNAQWERLFGQAPQAVALMDENGRVVRINPEFTQLFGYSAQEAEGRSLCELIVPVESEGEDRIYQERLANGQRADTEAVRRRKDGSQLYVRVVSVPVSGPNGDVAVCALYHDITERKAAEAARQSLSGLLLEVQESERRHLARELHDEIGQLLTGLRLLFWLDDDEPEAMKARAEQALGIVDELLGRVRRLSFDLRPADLDQLGLLPALLGLFGRYTAQTGVQVDFRHQEVYGRFSTEVETSAYRIVQEALTNAARHAGVAGVSARVWADSHMMNIQIADRGCGFDSEAALAAPRSGGLIGMKERCLLLGGRMTIESAPGAGTTIIAEIPIGPGRGKEAVTRGA